MVVRMPGWPPDGEFVQRPIIAAVDGSPGSAPVVEFAIAEARVRGCDMILLHPAGDLGSPRDRVETVRGVPVHHRVDGDDPVAALAGICDRVAAVVVGRQVRGPVADSLPGSPGRAVLQHARCPVFLVGSAVDDPAVAPCRHYRRGRAGPPGHRRIRGSACRR